MMPSRMTKKIMEIRMKILLLLNKKILRTMSQPLKGINTVCYCNNGCGVFKGGIQNLKAFWLKIN
jgi:hypothetical protein